MKSLLKILGISLLATIIYIIGSTLLPFSESFKEATQNSSPIDLVYLFFVHTWITATIFYIGKKSDWNKNWLLLSLGFVYMAFYSFMTQIEVLFFNDTFEILSKCDGWLIMLANFLPLIVIVPLTLKIAKKCFTGTKPIILVKLNTILGKVALLAVIYVFIYFLFGYFVAWQFADLRAFYLGTPEKESFFRVMAGNFQNSHIIPFQFLRGVLFATFILPVVLMFRNKRRELLISLILIYTTTAIVLIIPNFLFPDTVRWAHFIEMMTSMTVFSIISWFIWRNS
ncbi:MAG: hypothetical protein K9H26_09200 [Prolixibacteraceae bacterium]|nr:hypothetical protein [Prolixibacteraceae bacterium]